jgi:hypothetical protein
VDRFLIDWELVIQFNCGIANTRLIYCRISNWSLEIICASGADFTDHRIALKMTHLSTTNAIKEHIHVHTSISMQSL